MKNNEPNEHTHLLSCRKPWYKSELIGEKRGIQIINKYMFQSCQMGMNDIPDFIENVCIFHLFDITCC